MLHIKYLLPDFTEQDAVDLALQHYGLHATACQLPGERDRNFYLQTDTGAEFVLKIANATERREILDLQNQAMQHLAERAPALKIPRVYFNQDGDAIVTITSREGATHFMRLLTYVPAKLFAHVKPHSPELLRSLGRVLGEMNAALFDFNHPPRNAT